MSKLLAVVERYPDIKSSSTYQLLMNKLVDIENRIIKKREEHNLSVRGYNAAISSFPWYLLARSTGFSRREYFVTDSGGAAKAPLLAPETFNRLFPDGGGDNK